MSRRRHAPARVVAALIVALVVAFLPGAASPAHADAGLEARFLDLVDRARADAGVAPVVRADDLTAVGRRHAARMADGADLHHNPSLGGDVTGWDKVGENVGRGPDLDRIHAAFLDSPTHRANILDPEWTEAGVGVEVRDGTIWVTQLFRLPTGPAPERDAAETETAGADGPNSVAADAGDEEPDDTDPAPEPVPVSHEVREVPPPVDRISVVLARLATDDRGEQATRPWRSLAVR
jgi:hypothetical protein